ncbi:MAG TPA: SDR family oxidoreductase, partial [Gemmatimonadaceae bacterium]|nr:SDR family oxidoreductase [Gemmatimonadaceae bacterium]
MSNARVVGVTGASAGLGRAIVRAFAHAEYDVGLLARGPERLDAARAEVEQAGRRAVALSTDVADADAVERAVDRIEHDLGPIDVWVNNAMVSVFSPVKQMEAAEYRRVTEVTYLGYVYATLAVLKRMLPRDRGVIVHVGSALAHRSIPLQSAYCASKHAIWGFHESLISELRHDGSAVRSTMVQMPAMNTPQFDWVRSRLQGRAQPVPPIFEPEVGARAVRYAAEHDVGRELLVAWPTVKAVFGEKVVPRYIDRLLARDGYDDQQAEEPEDPDRPDNLFAPVPGPFAARGRFAGRSHDASAELSLRLRREWLLLAGAGLAGVALGALTSGAREAS